MTDLRVTFDRLVTGLGRLSLIAHARDVVSEARHICRPRCGNCDHWMKVPNCPREGGIGSAKGGPSCEAPVCVKYLEQRSVRELYASRMAEAENLLAQANRVSPGQNT